MSTLGSIRKRSSLLLLVIGLAMLAFILGDFMQSKRGGSGGGIFIGEVSGEDISIQIFQEKVQKGTENWQNQNQNSKLTQNTLAQIRNSIWDEHIKELIMHQEFEKLGIDVDSDELFELFQGDNVHSEISKIPIFQDANTKLFDRAKAVQYMKNLENDQTGEAQQQWIEFEDYIANLRRSEKYKKLVEQGMYVTSAEAMLSFNQGNANISIEYVSIPFQYIVDSLIDVSESEVSFYYENHINDYQQEASRNVDYVVYTVVPSEEDDKDTKDNISNLIKDFSSYGNFEVFVKRNSDNTSTIYNFTTQDEIKDTNSSSLFNADKGTVFGPYKFSETTYRIAKLVDIQYRPDSVEARHILLSPDQERDQDSIRILVQELRTRIEKGEDFAKLAEQNSVDKTSAIKGGDLGWFKEGAMVTEFNDTCFTAKLEKLYIAETQFGVHLIKVTKKSRSLKKVKIAYVDRIVEPSSETYHAYYTKAAQFAGTLLNSDTITFDELAESKNLLKRNENNMSASKQNISGLENSRAIIRWMQNANVGEVSEVFEFENNYVVAMLTKINKAGNTPIDDIKDEIETEVIKEKKGNTIVDQIKSKNYKSLNELAVYMNSKVQTVSNLGFATTYVENLGVEPKLVGLIYSSRKGEITAPIVGVNSVFVAKVISKNEKKISGDFSQQQNQISKTIKQTSSIAAYNTLKQDAKVIDNRNAFY